jgi:tetratricopeptide (TPR) repeat protein
MRHIRTIFFLVLISSAAATHTNAQTNTDTVFEMPGVFRISLLQGWQKSEVIDDRYTVAAFSTKGLTLEVMRDLARVPVEQYANNIADRNLAPVWDEYPGKYLPVEALPDPTAYNVTVPERSDEYALIGGLPAQWVRYRIEYKSPSEPLHLVRVWTVFILSPGEYWSLQLRGDDRFWPASDSDLQRMVRSFQLMEPMQARVKATIPPDAWKRMPATLHPNECLFGGIEFGMSIVLPCVWKLDKQWQGAPTKDGLIGWQRLTRSADWSFQHGRQLALGHYVGNWTADEFFQKQIDFIIKNVPEPGGPGADGFHHGNKREVLVDGIPGAITRGRPSFHYSDKKKKGQEFELDYADLLIVSKGNDHFSLILWAGDPDDVLEESLGSVQFFALHPPESAVSSRDDAMAGIVQAILDRSGGDVSTLFTDPVPVPTGHKAKPSHEKPAPPGAHEMERIREDVRLLKDSGSHYRLGKALDASGDQAAAFTEFETAVQLNPRNAEADREIARVYAGRNELPSAIAAHERVLLYSGTGDKNANAHLAALYAKSGNTLFALFHLIAAGDVILEEVTLRKDEVEPGYKALQELTEQVEAAKKELNEEPAPQKLQSMLSLAELLMKYGNFAYADNQCRLVHQVEPRNLRALACLVKTANARGEQDAMVGYALEWLVLSPNNPEIYFWLARGYSWAPADYVKAAESYEAMLRNAGQVQFTPTALREARVAIPRYYANSEMWQKAAAAHESAVRELPGDAEALNAAAWFFATTEKAFRNPTKALEYANRALAVTPGDVNIMDTLAEAYFVNGRINDAVATEQKALALAPQRADLQKQMEKFERAKKTESPHRK